MSNDLAAPIGGAELERATAGATKVCAVARDTFEAGSTGVAGMREAVGQIDAAIALWNGPDGAAAARASAPAQPEQIGAALALLLKGIPKTKDEDREVFGQLLFEGMWAGAKPDDRRG
ncbi:hypothetical protein [Rhodopseudomonas sp. B29]|uniref:hypothetical protein n=1 Tax=Rhodopseudomonas sp. B29 TaxID=95607 RepID=UPI00034B116A|nr:hypothetical protein [Rhodopseudomonas sp. B29]